MCAFFGGFAFIGATFNTYCGSIQFYQEQAVSQKTRAIEHFQKNTITRIDSNRYIIRENYPFCSAGPVFGASAASLTAKLESAPVQPPFPFFPTLLHTFAQR